MCWIALFHSRSAAGSDGQPVNTEETRAVVLQVLQEAGATGDLAAAIRSHASPHFVIHLANGESGGVDFAASAAREMYEAFPDVALTLEGLASEGDRSMIQFTMSGTHTGDLRGFAPTGKSVSIPIALGFRVEDSRLVEVWLYANLFAPLIATYAESHPGEAV